MNRKPSSDELMEVIIAQARYINALIKLTNIGDK